MEELMAALQATESSMKSFESEFKQTKKIVDGNIDPIQKKRSEAKKMIDFNSAKKAVQKSSPSVSFSKTQRFKANQDLDSSIGSVDSNSTVESNTSIGVIRTRSPAILFGKTQRFQQNKSETKREFDLNPKYDLVKRREPGAVIKSPIKVEKPKAKKIQQQQQRTTVNQENDESMETVRLENIERVNDSMSDIFSDTTEILGPGAYKVNYSGVEVKKSIGFPKTARFKEPSVIEGTSELNPKYEAVKKSAPGVKIAKEIPKNEKLLKKKDQEEMYQKVSYQIKKQAPIENDTGIRRNIPQVVMKDINESLSEKERLLKIFNLLNKRREERKVAPGTYEPQTLDEPICTVVYRKSLSPKVLRKPERLPSPTRYYAVDDLIRTAQPAFTFNKDGVDDTPKLKDFDMRKPLDVNLDLVKPRVPGAVILPEHKEEAAPELEDIKRGPGAYDVIHDLTEKRTDIGVMKFADLNEHNMRENQVDMANKEAFKSDLDPNYDVNKPRVPGFVYHQPVELEGPTHIPESMLHPEQWKFYDPNINAIKPELGDIEFAGGLTREEFIDKEKDFNQFMAYQARKDKKPEAGQYDVKYNAIEPEPKAPDFAKYPEREDKTVDKDQDVDGDILILNPERPKPHMPNIKFETMVGREEEKGPEDKEELILNPVYNLVEPRTVTLVNMAKQLDKPEDKRLDENKEELILDVNYNQIDPKVKGIPDLAKTTTREDYEAKRNDDKEELILNPSHDLVKESVLGGVAMHSKTKRFAESPEKDLNDGRETTDQRIDYNKTLDATKPEVNVVDFNRYVEREQKRDPKKMLKELNLKLKKADLPIIEEEKFEKYPEDNKDAGKEKKTGKGKKGEDRKVNLRESNEFKPWADNNQEDPGDNQDNGDGGEIY